MGQMATRGWHSNTEQKEGGQMLAVTGADKVLGERRVWFCHTQSAGCIFCPYFPRILSEVLEGHNLHYTPAVH